MPLIFSIRFHLQCFKFWIFKGRNRKRYADSSGIVFDVNVHSGKELHQFKFYGIELILGVLGTDNFVDKVSFLSFKQLLLFCGILSKMIQTIQYLYSICLCFSE